MKFFDILKSIYKKDIKKVDFDPDFRLNVNLVKYLAYDKGNLKSLEKIADYIIYLEPINFFYLLYFNVRNKRAPFLKRVVKQKEKKINKLENKIKDVLGWSNREFNRNRNLLEKIIDKKYWNKELGLK
jgi:hypothetical protein